jgi:hypothetical protein
MAMRHFGRGDGRDGRPFHVRGFFRAGPVVRYDVTAAPISSVVPSSAVRPSGTRLHAVRRDTILRVTGSEGARDRATRKADALAMLVTPAVDVWVASASPKGAPHLVPVSLAWVDERAVIAVENRSITAHNLSATGTARLAVGATRDVVIMDAVLERAVEVGADDRLGSGYAAQADWDPRLSSGYVFFVLRPVRVQAWREADEIAGRTLMRDGTWLV